MKSRSYQTDSARTRILKTVAERFEESTNPAYTALVPTFLEPVKQNYDTFNQLKKEDERIEALISEKTDGLKGAYPALKRTVRRFWTFLVDRQNSTNGSPELLRQFGLSGSGKRPSLRNREKILSAARKIIAGEAVAISRGLPPMGPITATEIEAAVIQIETEETVRNGLKEAYDLNLAALVRHRKQIDRQIVKLRAHLRTALMDEPMNTQRQLQRRLGFTFEADRNASESEEDVPEPILENQEVTE